MMPSPKTYLPAAGHDWLLPLYDPIVKVFGGDAARRALVEQAALRPDQRVLEIGCGTGTLAVQIKRRRPLIDVFGLDPDAKALARAKEKAVRAAVSIQFDEGFAGSLPYPDASFHRVFSSFMFHHLSADDKRTMLDEVRRVLKDDGEFHMLDFESPKDGSRGFIARLVHSDGEMQGNADGAILGFMKNAGFTEAKKVSRRTMLFGVAAYYWAIV
jgi:ubiquinone/menaquinone biosynthesis C-methylase UbiE